MKLELFDLLSFEPAILSNVGSIRSPLLKDIAKIRCTTYQSYISLLLLTPKIYYEMSGIKEEAPPDLSVYDLITADETMYKAVEAALDFFFCEKVVYNPEHRMFFTYNGAAGPDGEPLPTGIIHREIYSQVCDLILQQNYIQKKEEDLSEIKNKRALSIAMKLQRGREAKQTKARSNQNMELGNIISAVAAKHESLNPLNIWDITIYQLWDTFYRLCGNNILSIQSMSVAAWGDKEKQFDPSGWFQRMN